MNMELIEAVHEIEKEKGIPAEKLFLAIEAALYSAYKKNYSSAQNADVKIDRITGVIKVFACKDVVENVEDSRIEISLAEAKEIDPNYEVGDIAKLEVTPRDFGRIAAQTAKQVVIQRIREEERGLIYDEYINREGDIVTGVVQRYDQRNIIVDLGRVEALLPYSEQIPGERFEPFQRIKTYVLEVKDTTKGPQILLSRTHPGLIKRLFELEVPEIHDGIVEIKAVAREAGARSKLAVYSRDSNVDPVGACVGPKGSRVQNIVSELNGEKMDIITWSTDPVVFVSNSLSPAKVLGVFPKHEEKVTLVVVPDYQLSLAIGKEGQNARLAAKLTGWKIDIKNESQALAQNLVAPEELMPEAPVYEEEYQEEYYEDNYSDDYNEEDYVEIEGYEESADYYDDEEFSEQDDYYEDDYYEEEYADEYIEENDEYADNEEYYEDDYSEEDQISEDEEYYEEDYEEDYNNQDLEEYEEEYYDDDDDKQ